jgi:hypothetical protein
LRVRRGSEERGGGERYEQAVEAEEWGFCFHGVDL